MCNKNDKYEVRPEQFARAFGRKVEVMTDKHAHNVSTYRLGPSYCEKISTPISQHFGIDMDDTHTRPCHILQRHRQIASFLKEGVQAVPLQDILSSITSPTVVMKLDIEGYECKVLKKTTCDALYFSELFRLCKCQFFLEKVGSLFLSFFWSGL